MVDLGYCLNIIFRNHAKLVLKSGCFCKFEANTNYSEQLVHLSFWIWLSFAVSCISSVFSFSFDDVLIYLPPSFFPSLLSLLIF